MPHLLNSQSILKDKIMQKKTFNTFIQAIAFANKSTSGFYIENHGIFFTVTVYPPKL